MALDHIVITVMTCLATRAPAQVRIWDGDTLWLGERKIRIADFDTPERGRRAHCRQEREKAEEARQRLATILSSAERVEISGVQGHSYDREVVELRVGAGSSARCSWTRGWRRAEWRKRGDGADHQKLLPSVFARYSNAAKCGASSNDAGRVRIGWLPGADGSCRFERREEEGPDVVEPARRGFGSGLTDQIVPSDVEGSGETQSRPGGLCYVLDGTLPTETPAPAEPTRQRAVADHG